MTDTIRDRARALGLDKLTDDHLAQLERATAGFKRHLDRLPTFEPAQEPAHIYQAKGRDR